MSTYSPFDLSDEYYPTVALPKQIITPPIYGKTKSTGSNISLIMLIFIILFLIYVVILYLFVIENKRNKRNEVNNCIGIKDNEPWD